MLIGGGILNSIGKIKKIATGVQLVSLTLFFTCPGRLRTVDIVLFMGQGSVLNGGLAGHAWGDAYYAGVATNPIPGRGGPLPASDPHKNGLNRWCAVSMGHLKDFIVDSSRWLVPDLR